MAPIAFYGVSESAM